MAVVRWDPWGELAALQRDVNELFGRTAGGRQTAASVPAMDAYRTEEELVVLLDLPGFAPDQVDVAVNEGMLTVSGERAATAEVGDDQWLRRERTVGRFERSFSLPQGTNPADIAASFDNGVLRLAIPHPPERKPHRVKIEAGDASSQTVDVG